MKIGDMVTTSNSFPPFTRPHCCPIDRNLLNYFEVFPERTGIITEFPTDKLHLQFSCKVLWSSELVGWVFPGDVEVVE